MPYIITALGTATYPTRVGETPLKDNWVAGVTHIVDDALIQWYLDHDDVFTVIAADGGSPEDLETITGLTGLNNAAAIVQQTTFTFTDMAVTVTDALAYASKKLFTFSKGRLLVLGAYTFLKFAVTSDRASTINDSASLTWSLGSAAASNATLSSTMVNVIPKTTKLLDGAVAAYTAAASVGVLAAPFYIDGTSTASPLYLNYGFETGTDIDADGVIDCKGTAIITWANIAAT